jgi:hypothetical protein
MRKPEYISPTSYFLWKKDREEFYKKYMSDRRFLKDPQTMPMAVGSAFDFMIKKELMTRLGMDKSVLDALKLQIEDPLMMEEATLQGVKVYDFYTKCGALSNLLSEIGSVPRFEFRITGNIKSLISNPSDSNGIPLHGRPDAFFLSKEKASVVLDWKVNGWLSQRTTSPKPGYVDFFPNRKFHKDSVCMLHKGVMVNINSSQFNEEWATQCSIYSWLLGSEVGAECIAGIDQILGPSDNPRVAKFRFLIDSKFQLNLYGELTDMWNKISSGLIFDDLNDSENASRCEALESQILIEDELFKSGKAF